MKVKSVLFYLFSYPYSIDEPCGKELDFKYKVQWFKSNNRCILEYHVYFTKLYILYLTKCLLYFT